MVSLAWDIQSGDPVFSGVPDSLQVGIEVQVCRGCAFVDDDPSNVTPFFDNLQVCVTGASVAGIEPDPSLQVGDGWMSFAGPNPLNTTSALHLRLSARDPVEVRLFAPSGRRVSALRQEVLAPGEVTVLLGELLQSTGRPIPSGSYLMQVRAGALLSSRRVVIAR